MDNELLIAPPGIFVLRFATGLSNLISYVFVERSGTFDFSFGTFDFRLGELKFTLG